MTETVEFYRAVIEGVPFTAEMASDGPYISAEFLPGDTEGVNLGNCCSIIYLSTTPTRDFEHDARWWVAKYDREARIPVNGLSAKGRRELSRCFGIPIVDLEAPRDLDAYQRIFLASPAFAGLCEWASKHPQLAKEHIRSQAYMPWMRWVCE